MAQNEQNEERSLYCDSARTKREEHTSLSKCLQRSWHNQWCCNYSKCENWKLLAYLEGGSNNFHGDKNAQKWLYFALITFVSLVIVEFQRHGLGDSFLSVNAGRKTH